MIGQTVGKYRIVERIGRGGMGTVYRAHDEMLDRDVAIKVLNPELNDPDVARRFRAEAVTVARLNHPGIATIHELLQHDDQWLMVMEFVQGETLEHLVHRAGALTPERAAQVCSQALHALGHAHRMGVVHRDLKPANLMLTESGLVKIMDFGIARVAGTDHLTHIGHMMGTPAYMAPEQVLGHDVDARSDLYAMGVVLYRLTTGKLPFKGDTAFAMAQSQLNDPPTPVRVTREGVPMWVEMVTAKALAKAPADRFQTAQEFAHALDMSLGGLPSAVSTTGTLASPTAATGAGPAAGTTASVFVSPTDETQLQRTPAHEAETMLATSRPSTAVSTAQTTIHAPATVTLKRRNVTAIGAAALVVVAGAIGVAIYRSRPGAAPPTSPETAVAQPPVVTPAPVEVPPPPDPQSTATPASPGSTSAASTPTTGPAPGSSSRGSVQLPPNTQPPIASAARGRDAATGATSSTGAPAPAAPVAPPPPAAPSPAAVTSDPHISFVDVKMLQVTGSKGNDQDVVLNLAAGQISLVPKKGGAALQSLPYNAVAHATYSHAKKPEWDASFSSPPTDLDVPGGLFRSSPRHWLTLQTRSEYMILRLPDASWAGILDTIQSRTGVTIARPVAK